MAEYTNSRNSRERDVRTQNGNRNPRLSSVNKSFNRERDMRAGVSQSQTQRNISMDSSTEDVSTSPPALPERPCAYCEKLAQKICSRCGEGYCSVRCQQNDWYQHKSNCREMPPLVDLRIAVSPAPVAPQSHTYPNKQRHDHSIDSRHHNAFPNNSNRENNHRRSVSPIVIVTQTRTNIRKAMFSPVQSDTRSAGNGCHNAENFVPNKINTSSPVPEEIMETDEQKCVIGLTSVQPFLWKTSVELPTGCFVEVVPTLVEDNNSWVNLASASEVCNDLLKDANTCQKMTKLNVIKAGVLGVTKFEELYYRCVVVNESPCRVRLLDYGNEFDINPEDIFEPMGNLLSVAGQAIRVVLAPEANVKLILDKPIKVKATGEVKNNCVVITVAERTPVAKHTGPLKALRLPRHKLNTSNQSPESNPNRSADSNNVSQTVDNNDVKSTHDDKINSSFDNKKNTSVPIIGFNATSSANVSVKENDEPWMTQLTLPADVYTQVIPQHSDKDKCVDWVILESASAVCEHLFLSANTFPEYKPLQNIIEGALCIVVYDDCKYRAVINSVAPLLVTLLDYGNLTSVKQNEIYEPDITMRQSPPQAIPVVVETGGKLSLQLEEPVAVKPTGKKCNSETVIRIKGDVYPSDESPTPIKESGSKVVPAPIKESGSKVVPAPIKESGSKVVPAPIKESGSKVVPAPIKTRIASGFQKLINSSMQEASKDKQNRPLDSAIVLLKVGSDGIIQVQHQLSSNRFTVKIAFEEIIDIYNRTQTVLQEEAQVHFREMKDGKVGDFVASVVEGTWYRSIILSIDDDSAYKVFLCDIGTVDTVKHIYEITREQFTKDLMQSCVVTVRELIVTRDTFTNMVKPLECLLFTVTSITPAIEVIVHDIDQKQVLFKATLERWDATVEPFALNVIKPQEIKSGHEVVIMHIDGPQNLCLRLAKPSDNVAYSKIMQDVAASALKALPLICSPIKKELVCAHYAADGNYYRAIVIAVGTDDMYKVTYLDYGNSETVKFDSLRELPDPLKRAKIWLLKVKLLDVPDLPLNSAAQEFLNAQLQLDPNQNVFKMVFNGSYKNGVSLLYESGDSFNAKLSNLLQPSWQQHLGKETEFRENYQPVMLEDLKTVPIELGPDVDIVFLTDPLHGCFVGCQQDTDLIKQLLSIQSSRMAEYCTKIPLSYMPRSSEICIAKYDSGIWYRATCLEAQDNQCMVLGIDNGTTCAVSNDNIRRIPKAFLDPALAVFFIIDGFPDDMPQGLIDHMITLIKPLETVLNVTVLEQLTDGEYLIRLPDDIMKKLKSKGFLG